MKKRGRWVFFFNEEEEKGDKKKLYVNGEEIANRVTGQVGGKRISGEPKKVL